MKNHFIFTQLTLQNEACKFIQENDELSSPGRLEERGVGVGQVFWVVFLIDFDKSRHLPSELGLLLLVKHWPAVPQLFGDVLLVEDLEQFVEDPLEGAGIGMVEHRVRYFQLGRLKT